MPMLERKSLSYSVKAESRMMGGRRMWKKSEGVNTGKGPSQVVTDRPRKLKEATAMPRTMRKQDSGMILEKNGMRW